MFRQKRTKKCHQRNPNTPQPRVGHVPGWRGAKSSKGEGTGPRLAARWMDALAPLVHQGLGIWWLEVAAPHSTAIPMCCWVLRSGSSCNPKSPQTPPGSSWAELLPQGRVPGCAQTRTLPGAGAAARREPQQEATPSLHSPKAIKNEAHSAAQLSSHQITAHETAAAPSSPAGAGNAAWPAQHPAPLAPVTPGTPPHPKINWQAGMQEKAPSSALPPHSRDALAKAIVKAIAALRQVPLWLFSAALRLLKDTMAVAWPG